MKNLEITIDLGALATKLKDQPDVTGDIKRRLKTMFSPPTTMEDLTKIISAANETHITYPRINLPTMEKQILKARFHYNASEIDYV